MSLTKLCLYFPVLMGTFYVYSAYMDNEFDSILLPNVENNTLNEGGYKGPMEENSHKESQADSSGKTSRSFERMIQLLNILGQVDTFLSERTKSVMRKLALLADDDDYYHRKRRS